LEIAGAIFYDPDSGCLSFHPVTVSTTEKNFFNKEESKAKIQHDKRTWKSAPVVWKR